MPRRPATTIWSCLWLPLLSIAIPSRAFPQDDPLLEGVYVMKLGSEEVGREKVRVTETGWSCQSTYDILGVQKGAFEASNDEKDGVQHFSLQTVQNDQEITMDLTREQGRLKGKVVVGENSVEIDYAFEGPGLVYSDLLWSFYIDLGRHFVRELGEERLRAGHVVNGLLPNPQGMKIPIELKELGPLPQVVNGELMSLLSFRVNLASRVDVVIVCREDGIPLRFAIPSQNISGSLEGFESVVLPSSNGRSVLDKGPWRQKLSPADHEVVVEKQVMIPMRDGVKLACDIYRPKGDGEYPAILVRTPYSRATEGLTKGDRYAARGYAVIVQDVRGRFDSEGEWYPLIHEVDDGSDTIDWIAEQDWCTGQVGMIGASYVGWVQWYAAKSGNPHLKAIIPQVSPPDPDQNFPYEGGAFMLGGGWWAKVLEHMEAVGGAALPDLDFSKILRTLPLGDLDKELGVTHPFLDDWIARSPVDPYWDAVRYQGSYEGMNVAVLNLSGWFDGDQPGAPQNFLGMRESGPEAMRPHQYLLLGPWGHAFNIQQKMGEVDFGEEAIIDLDAIVIRFFDRYLKGIENGIDQAPKVMTFTMGANKWYRGEEWPPKGTVPTKLYLTSSGKAQKKEDGGTLTLEPTHSGVDAFLYDPKNPRFVDADFNDVTSSAATADVSKMEDRADYLDYISAPLAAPVEITGPVTAILSVSTDAKDTDFTVEVNVIEKGGAERGLSAGIQRLRYRNGKDEPVEPGTVVTIEVDCWATSKRLEAGDRLHVVIGSCFLP
ncbi:MAG: CocE/NonD family hydrolase, partial [Planctomycetota bacterium]